MTSLLSSKPEFLKKADEFAKPPPPGKPYSISLPGSETSDRSAVYRHRNCKDSLLETLDPNVGLHWDDLNLNWERC